MSRNSFAVPSAAMYARTDARALSTAEK